MPILSLASRSGERRDDRADRWRDDPLSAAALAVLRDVRELHLVPGGGDSALAIAPERLRGSCTRRITIQVAPEAARVDGAVTLRVRADGLAVEIQGEASAMPGSGVYADRHPYGAARPEDSLLQVQVASWRLVA